MYIDDANKKFLINFFDTHHVWRVDNLPWVWFNYENGRMEPLTNNHVRVDYMFSEYGFFNEMIKELDPNYLDSKKRNDDFSYYHRQRRYVVQSNIEDDFHNPTHHSFRTYQNEVIDFDKPEKLFEKKKQRPSLVSHPGHTRFESSCFLRKNLKNALIYVHKDNFYEKMFSNKKEMEYITSVNELVKSWKPLPISFKIENGKTFHNIILPREKSRFEFMFLNGEKPGMKNGTKYHQNTGCNVLKLWDYRPSVGSQEFSNKHLLHTTAYVHESVDSGKEIATTWNKNKFTIYTNSKKNVEKHFKKKRKELINFAKNIMSASKNKPNPKKFYFNETTLMEKFWFDVIEIENKPDEDLISILNDNDGFAMWIDDSVLEKIDREIYEFMFFVKNDVKVARTHDKKIMIINCKIDKGKTWIIEEEFYL